MVAYGERRRATAPRAVLYAALISVRAAALPAAAIRASGEAAGAAIERELMHQLLHDVVSGIERGAIDPKAGFPAAHRALSAAWSTADSARQKQARAAAAATPPDGTRAVEGEDEGWGLLSSVYLGRADGSMYGVRLQDPAGAAVWVGTAPSDPALKCADPENATTCRPPDGVAPGRLETWKVGDDPGSWVLDNLESNGTYDPRTMGWYASANRLASRTEGAGDGKAAGAWSTTFVQTHGPALPTLGITLSLPFPGGGGKNGKTWQQVAQSGELRSRGVAAVDFDLSALDMILGPLRPASGAELLVADVRDNTVVAATLPAARLVRLRGTRLSIWDPPFAQVFVPVVRAFGDLHRAQKYGTMLLRADQLMGSMLRWDSLLIRPIRLPGGLEWLLVVTDDSDRRAADAAAAGASPVIVAAAAAAAAAVLL